ncbi:MAG: helix-turn-helix domain-containing protein [Paracoccaceae bacterium]|uniref:GlxA family transcriptional regulator n=1 Tax=Yoonia sp. TaxID=2212373 RepID=UPI0032837EF7
MSELNFPPNLFPTPSKAPDLSPEMRVGFVLSPQFSLLPVASFLDALRHAADEADFGRQIYCSWKIVGPEEGELIPSSCGLGSRVDCTFPDPSEFDYLVVAGGRLPDCLNVPEETLAYIRQARAAGVTLVGICTGSFLLAHAGVVDDTRCAVHAEHSTQMRALFPKTRPITDQLIVSDNDTFTCPGGSTALDLAFSLIRSRCGRARAVKSLTSLMVGKERAAELAPDREYAQLFSCGNSKVENAVGIMESHLSEPFSIKDLAERVNISANGLLAAFNRHAGVGPTEVWRNIRLAHSRWLLLNTSRTVTQIAFECGFADCAHFSRWFQKRYETSPTDFRKGRKSP